MNENGFYNLGLMTCVLISCCLSGKRGPYNLLRWLLWWSRVSGVRSEYQPVVVCKRCPEGMMSSLAQEHGHLAHAHLGTLHLRIEPLLVSQTFWGILPSPVSKPIISWHLIETNSLISSIIFYTNNFV